MHSLPGGCRVFDAADGDVSTHGNWTSRTLTSHKYGAKYVAQMVHEYAQGHSPAVVNPEAEEVLYTISGRGACRLSGYDYPLESGVGVYVPKNTPYSIRNPGPGKLQLVSACCPEDDRRRVLNETLPLASNGGNAPPRTVREQDRDLIPVSDRHFRLMVDKDLGCNAVTQFVGFIPPSKAPLHFHKYEEVIYILDGKGILHIEQADCEVNPGSAIFLPIGLWHCLENPGPGNLRLLGTFYPSGSPGEAYEQEKRH